ncbi:MAG: NUDIX domain-containing protein [Acidimicrobiia bacterium]|nr:NUDIX domain-containing protein [Acidimicrobiia bacterium]
MTEPAGLRIRDSARALLLTPRAEVLMVRFEFPGRTVWALPGGGLEPGESHEQALHRELAEEVGLTGVEVGPHIWNREHIIPFLDGQWDGQRDRIYLVHTERFDPSPQLSWEQLRAERLHELRWWTAEEVGTVRDEATFAPGRMPELLHRLVDEGPPPAPIDTGV